MKAVGTFIETSLDGTIMQRATGDVWNVSSIEKSGFSTTLRIIVPRLCHATCSCFKKAYK